MTNQLSRADFDRLIARASKLDDEGIGQLDLERARVIAMEVGISPEAWETALQERALVPQESSVAPLPLPRLKLDARVGVIALVGIVTGALSGTIGNSAGPLALFLGALAIAVGAGLAVFGSFKSSHRATQLEVAAWWVSVFTGIVVGLQQVHSDPIVFGSLGWAACAALAYGVRRWIRRDPAPSSLAGTPAA